MGPAAAAPCPRATGLPRPWGPPGPRDGRAGGRRTASCAGPRLSRGAEGRAAGPRSAECAAAPRPRAPRYGRARDSGNCWVYLFPRLGDAPDGLAGAGRAAWRAWGGGAARSQVQPRPGKFPCRPELGVAFSPGSPGPSAGDPPRACGRALGWLETLCQFLSIQGTPPLHPSPAPHPTPRDPPRGCQLQPIPHELAGPGRSLLFRFGKVFKGFFLALLVSDWASGGRKGGGRFRCCFHCTVFARRPPPLFYIPYPTEQP